MVNSTRIDVWDGWRGVAISAVMIGHFCQTSWIWEERFGVDVFFVLSGMLMSNILFVQRMHLRDFYIRRFSRVIPTLVLYLIASFFVGIIMKYDFKLSELVASLFFIRTYLPVEPVYFSANLPTGHLWSLNVEEHSYNVMSLMSLIFIARGKIISALLAIFVFSVGLNVYQYTHLPLSEFEFSLIRTEQAAGFIAFSAAYSLIRKDMPVKNMGYWPLILFVSALVCYLDFMPVWLTFIAGPILLGVAVNHLVDAAKPVKAILLFAPLRWIGIFSYSIYLWQQIFYKLFYALPGKAVTGFVLSLVVGIGSFYIVENPARKYINKRWSPKPKYRSTVVDSHASESAVKG